MEQFPTVEALAAATPAAVLRAWQGLGYDRRALALWRTARIVVDEHGGRIPSTWRNSRRSLGSGRTRRARSRHSRSARPWARSTSMSVACSGGSSPEMQSPFRHLRSRTSPMTRSRPTGRATGPTPSWTSGRSSAALERPGATPARRVRGVASPRAGHATRAARSRAPRKRPPTIRFAATNRWLRGRILDRLRAAPDGDWVAFDGAIGTHDLRQVRAAADAMAADGVLEIRSAKGPDSALRARLPLA